MHLDKTTDGVELTEVVCVRHADSCSVCVCELYLVAACVCVHDKCLFVYMCVSSSVYMSCVCVCSCHGPVRSEYPEDTVSQD